MIQTTTQSKSQPNDNQIMIQGVNLNALTASTGEEESGGDAYDKIKPLSKKSFDEDKTLNSMLGLGGGTGGGNLNLRNNA